MTQHHPQYESALDALRHHCRPRAFRPAFASVAEAVRQLSGQPKRQGSVEETTTRTTHPCELCDLEGGKCAQLLGVGYGATHLDRRLDHPGGFSFFSAVAVRLAAAASVQARKSSQSTVQGAAQAHHGCIAHRRCDPVGSASRMSTATGSLLVSTLQRSKNTALCARTAQRGVLKICCPTTPRRHRGTVPCRI